MELREERPVHLELDSDFFTGLTVEELVVKVQETVEELRGKGWRAVSVDTDYYQGGSYRIVLRGFVVYQLVPQVEGA